MTGEEGTMPKDDGREDGAMTLFVKPLDQQEKMA
jgi:hypothetical protein